MPNTIIEPFKIKVVEPIRMSSISEREQYLASAFFNPFLIDADKVIIDLLTDSGTSAMSGHQWAMMMEGDESYAGAHSWQHMHQAIQDLTGFQHVLPTHQGRAAERILYAQLGGKDKVFLSNTHFDTTRANIEYTGAEAIDCLTEVGRHPEEEHPFKGNIDLEQVEKQINRAGANHIGAIILTVTNNSGGGQPVSMENARLTSELCRRRGIPFILDACRIAENSYFISKRETGYETCTYRDIAKEMFSLADGCIMSAKKDGLVNMGGFLALRDEALAKACSNMLIITEGFVTYGGLTGRDMEAIAVGLSEVFDPDYLNYRIISTTYLGNRLSEIGVPIVKPVGGHAVYVDARNFYHSIPVDEYPGQSLVCNLYKIGGVRSVEVGSVMFGKYDQNGQLIPAPMDLVRLAIPRRVYTQSHIDYVVDCFKELIESSGQAKGLKITYEPKFLRHFTAHFEQVS